jgi:hypothetical protein
MKLLANGCSWTQGGGLDLNGITRQELDQVTWPKHLHDLLGATDFVNLAAGCGSNQRIFRTTLDYLLDNKDEDIVAVIQLTEESRFEYYYPMDIDKQYENINDRWMRAKINNLIPQVMALDNFGNIADIDGFDKHYKLSQERLVYHTSDIQNIYAYIEHCEALSSLFKRFNIKYYFWDICDLPNRLPEPFKTFLLESYPWINYINGSWQYWEYDRIEINVDSHPNHNGHKQLAQHINSAIKEDFK